MGDELGLAKANLALANCKLLHERPLSEAAALMQGVREALSAGGLKRSLAGAINTLGIIAIHGQNLAEAVDYLSLAAELAGQLKNVRRAQGTKVNLALVEFSRGNIERAIEIGQDTVGGSRPLPHRVYIEAALENLSTFLLAADRIGEARTVAEEALAIVRGKVVSVVTLRRLQQWALIAALEGQDPDAARLIGWVDAAYQRMGGATRNFWEASDYDRILSQLRVRLSDGELSAFAAEGARWDAEGAMNFTFDHIIRRQASPL